MQILLLVILFLLGSCLSKAERVYDPIIDPNKFKNQYLEHLILEKVNQIRETYNAPPLELDSKLEQAATSQAQNMKSWNRVSHHQISLSKFSLTNRVQYFGIKNKHIGENVADIYLDAPMKVNFAKDILVIKTYKETADALALSWKYSPGHFKNMVDPDFRYTGISVEINPSKKTIYAAPSLWVLSSFKSTYKKITCKTKAKQQLKYLSSLNRRLISRTKNFCGFFATLLAFLALFAVPLL